MTIRLLFALIAILCGLAVIFIDLKADELTVLAVGVISAALAAVIDR